MTDNLMKLAIALGLAVLLPFLVYYGVAAVEPPPLYEDYFSEAPRAVPPPEAGGEAQPLPEKEWDSSAYRERQEAFDEARAAWSERLFLAALPVGFLAILIGGFVALPGVGPGLVLGGAATLTVAFVHQWEMLSNLWRFASLLAAFLALLFVAWRQLRKARG